MGGSQWFTLKFNLNKKAKLAPIKNIPIENNLVTITMSEAGDYHYSDDNINWQSSNQFKLENENYIIYVKTRAVCLTDQRSLSIFEIPHIFSPNAHVIIDIWKIKSSENYKDSQVFVFNRFGKKVVDTKVNGILNGTAKSMDSPCQQIHIGTSLRLVMSNFHRIFGFKKSKLKNSYQLMLVGLLPN